MCFKGKTRRDFSYLLVCLFVCFPSVVDEFFEALLSYVKETRRVPLVNRMFSLNYAFL